MSDLKKLPRRKFIKQFGLGAVALVCPSHLKILNMEKEIKQFDVIIIGGSYSGLAAGMALGRALKKVLIIDSGKPCNAQTPQSHNFLTQDGSTPKKITLLGKSQVEKYTNVVFYEGNASEGTKIKDGFEITTETGEKFQAFKLILSTGIKDIMPKIEGFAACWGISAIHCPYCHGYEVRNTKTGILGNGDSAFELAKMISNWTSDLTVFTNGTSTFTLEQKLQLQKHTIEIIDKEINKLDHINGRIYDIVFTDNTNLPLVTLYAPRPFVQHSAIPESLGCEFTDQGYIKVNNLQETSIYGVYAAGDNANRMRTVANAVATGTTAGMSASKKLILDQF